MFSWADVRFLGLVFSSLHYRDFCRFWVLSLNSLSISMPLDFEMMVKYDINIEINPMEVLVTAVLYLEGHLDCVVSLLSQGVMTTSLNHIRL